MKLGGLQEPRCLAIKRLATPYWRADVERFFSESSTVKSKLGGGGANPLNRENANAIFAGMMVFTFKGIVAVIKHGTQFWVSWVQ